MNGWMDELITEYEYRVSQQQRISDVEIGEFIDVYLARCDINLCTRLRHLWPTLPFKLDAALNRTPKCIYQRLTALTRT
jgi:hypothetical protein